ncbi:vacuolar protein sorting-associated protein 37B-like [Physella acuta]|uniref:vacuolar protein sorting-associated protein 37B-like n=1 Tax=Physella acuta TaxID=109671 RepID=UPI0027DE4F5B|nr:vacuolar protein sorting-associated protein 37B-like [Physella acuta]
MYQHNYGSGSFSSGNPSPYPSPHNNYYTPPSIGNDTQLPDGAGALSRMNEAAAISLLQHLDRTELQHLLDDEAKLKDLIDDLPQVKALQTEHDDLVASTKSLAEYNLTFEPKIENKKLCIASGYEKLSSIKSSFQETKATLNSLVDRQSLETKLALLQTETAKAEEESEELADKFCAGSIQTEEFLSQYLPQRTLAHLRRIKSERFAELIRDASSASTLTSTQDWGLSSQPSSKPPYPIPKGPAPYPTARVPAPVAPYPTSRNPAPVAPYPTSGIPSSYPYGMPQPGFYPR